LANPERVADQAKIWRAMLLEERRQEVLAQAQAILPDISEPRAAMEKEIAYFETNCARMTCAVLRLQGLCIE